ncbi:hypothetical protein ACX80Z_15480 [Arthrobacter sp. TMT4-20]
MAISKGLSAGQEVRHLAPELGLSALIQVNTDLNFATVVVRGSLTQTNSDALIRMVVSTSYLAPDLSMSIDLSGARSVDPEAVKRLGNYPAWSVIEPPPQPAREVGPDSRAAHLSAGSNWQATYPASPGLSAASDPAPDPLAGVGASSEPSAPSRLAPEEQFPEDLTDLDTLQVEVLNSRTGRQLDMEYVRDTEPDPETSTRLEELTEELDRRDQQSSDPKA